MTQTVSLFAMIHGPKMKFWLQLEWAGEQVEVLANKDAAKQSLQTLRLNLTPRQ